MAQPTVLLDLDGTLVDSLPGIESSCRAALVQLATFRRPTSTSPR